MPHRVLFVSLLVVISGCNLQPPPQAAQHQQPTLQDQIADLQRRVSTMEKVVSDMNKNVSKMQRDQTQFRADQSVVTEDLRVEIRGLRGNLEVLQHQIQTSEKRYDKNFEDMDVRLSDLENRTKGESSAKPTSRQGVRDSDAIAEYNRILRTILDKKDYATGVTQFQRFIEQHPTSNLAPNAQYWIGEGYFAQGDYKKAITEFQKVVTKFPDHEKKCDSILKQGISFAELKDSEKARLFLSEVTRQCPNTASSRRAKDRLAKLDSSVAN